MPHRVRHRFAADREAQVRLRRVIRAQARFGEHGVDAGRPHGFQQPCGIVPAMRPVTGTIDGRVIRHDSPVRGPYRVE